MQQVFRKGYYREQIYGPFCLLFFSPGQTFLDCVSVSEGKFVSENQSFIVWSDMSHSCHIYATKIDKT